jgi:YbgC/YbaW family acyl-CoA thioester hydrolase
VDLAGIVHFNWFLLYMGEAEQALWRAAGLNLAQPGAAVGFPRVAVACEYHRPLRFDEEFDICIRVAEMREKAIRYSCLMTRGDEPIATGTMTTVCVRKRPDQSFGAVPIPPEIAMRFEVATGVDA